MRLIITHRRACLLLFVWTTNLLFPSGGVLLLLCCCCHSYVITSGTWRFRGRHPIAYEQAARVVVSNDDSDDALSTPTTANTNDETETTLVLLLNGFGVGSFHQHRLIHELLGKQHYNNNANADVVVYCMDYLGQGASWPLDCQDGGTGIHEDGLRYCGTTWVEQITDFIQHVILKNHNNNKVHIVGNSVGGHLAAFCAAQSPHLIESLCLLNPTPFWGLNLPGWDGVLPAPVIPKLIGHLLFDVIRDLRTIQLFLMSVYANGRLAFDETLVQQIRACTEGPGGHAAFSSILWSPPISITVPTSSSSSSSTTTTTINNFYDCLGFLATQQKNYHHDTDDTDATATTSNSNNIPILLVFGKNDPWCKPALARRMMQQQQQNSNSNNINNNNAHAPPRYIELTNVGHCPNHEAPVATARILNTWWQQQQQHQQYNNTNDNHDLVVVTEAQQGEAVQQQHRQPLFPQRRDIYIQESWGMTRLQEKSREEIPLNLLDRLATAFV